MQQESIYSKLALNTSIAQRIEDNVRKNKPPEGLVQMLTITEKTVWSNGTFGRGSYK